MQAPHTLAPGGTKDSPGLASGTQEEEASICGIVGAQPPATPVASPKRSVELGETEAHLARVLYRGSSDCILRGVRLAPDARPMDLHSLHSPRCTTDRRKAAFVGFRRQPTYPTTGSEHGSPGAGQCSCVTHGRLTWGSYMCNTALPDISFLPCSLCGGGMEKVGKGKST